jgi:hypothetical protein
MAGFQNFGVKKMKTKRIVCVTALLALLAALPLSACASAPPAVTPPGGTLHPTVVATAPSTPPPSPSPTPAPAETPAPPPAATEPPQAGPDRIGFYLRSGTTYRLQNEFTGKWVKGKDICAFYTFASREETIQAGSYKKAFESYWFGYPDADEYKIGFRVVFTLKSGETVDLTIRSPKDAPKDPKKYFYQFVELYMYDSRPVPPAGKKRMHLVESAMKADMIMTSIKVTAGSRISEVTSIGLTAFVYRDDGDFDPATGRYIGNVSYEMPIMKSN